MLRLSLVAVLALALPAVAQEDNPDEDWSKLPGAKDPAPPPPPNPNDVPPRPAEPLPSRSYEDANPEPVVPAPGTPRASALSPRPVLEPNTVSMFGARSLGQWVRGEMLYLGFPLLGVRFAIGLTSRLDLGVGFDSFYTMMNEPRGTLRFNFYRGTNWSFAAAIEGGYAWFTTTARAEAGHHGARWLTGQRDGNIVPGLLLSYQGDHPRAVRLFASLQYLITLDNEPFQIAPLSGRPAAIQVGSNILFRAGAEMPLSAKTSFVFLLGLDWHGRSEDAVVMPACSVGLVTSI